MVLGAVTWGLTPLVALAMLVGLALPSRSRFGGVFHWWLVAIILFVFVAGRGSSWHAWYQLPLVPVAAALAGRAADAGLSGLTRRRRPGHALVLGGLCVAAAAPRASVSLQPVP